MTSDQGADPAVQALRERIGACDRSILETVNARLDLVRELHALKRERGYPVIDAGREQRLLDSLVAANGGPLSDAALRELFGALIATLTRESARLLDG